MSQIKNDRQVEFSVLAEKASGFGINGSELARRLGVNKSSVSQWHSGKSSPEKSKLILLRKIVGELEHPGSARYELKQERIVGMDRPEVEASNDMLSEIHEADPEGFETIKKVISTYHSRIKAAKPKPKLSSIGLPDNFAEHVERAAAASRPKAVRRPPKGSK